LRPRRSGRGPRPPGPRTAESRSLTPSRSPDHVCSAPPAPPPAPRRAIVSAPLPLGRRVVLAPWFGRCPAPAPARALSADIPRRGQARLALTQVHHPRPHTSVESGQVRADAGVTVEDVGRVLEDSILLAQLDGGRGDAAAVLLIHLSLGPRGGIHPIAQDSQR